eukprot:2735279-Prymnesium_polylepis.1
MAHAPPAPLSLAAQPESAEASVHRDHTAVPIHRCVRNWRTPLPVTRHAGCGSTAGLARQAARRPNGRPPRPAPPYARPRAPLTPGGAPPYARRRARPLSQAASVRIARHQSASHTAAQRLSAAARGVCLAGTIPKAAA